MISSLSLSLSSSGTVVLYYCSTVLQCFGGMSD